MENAVEIKKKKVSFLHGLGSLLIKYRAVWIAALLGAVIYLIIYGVNALDPNQVAWILYGDRAQHYLGAKAFRFSDWQFPFGLFDTLSYPYSFSIIYYDALPLLAVPLKIFSAILPAEFQYYGIWSLLCFMLQGALSACMLRKYVKTNLAAEIGSLFFIIAPIFLDRIFYHSALSAHWLILLALLFIVFYDERFHDVKKSAVAWGVLGFLTVGVQAYFTLLCGIVLVGFVVIDHLRTRKILRALVPLASYIGAAALNAFLLGAFGQMSPTNSGVTDFSFNLNGLVDSNGWSRLLPDLPNAMTSQYEGFAYLGAGMLVLIALTSVFLIVRAITKKTLTKDAFKTRVDVYGYAFIGLICVVFALSPMVTAGAKTLFTIPLPGIVEKLWGVFRSTGRAIWPLVYILMIYGICAAAKHVKTVIIIPVLVACVALQGYDISNKLVFLHNRYSGYVEYNGSYSDEVWDAVAKDDELKHLWIVNIIDRVPEKWFSIGDFTTDYGKTMNYFRYSRSPGDLNGLALIDELKSLSTDSVYIIYENDKMFCSAYDLHYYKTGEFYLGTVKALEGVEETDISELNSYKYPIGVNSGIANGEDADGVRTLHPGGISFGPYIGVPEGSYTVTLEGTNLDGVSFNCYYIPGSEQIFIPIDSVDAEDTHAEIRFTTTGAYGLEFYINNTSGEDVTITDYVITRDE